MCAIIVLYMTSWNLAVVSRLIPVKNTHLKFNDHLYPNPIPQAKSLL